MLQSGILAFCIFANDRKIYVLVTCRESGKRLAEDNGSINIELLADSNVPRYVTGLGDRGEEDTYRDDIRV